MRFKRKEKPRKGAMRISRRFALFPIYTEEEIAWLETAIVVEEFALGGFDREPRWYAERFGTKAEYEAFMDCTNRYKRWLSTFDYIDMLGSVKE